MFHIPILYEDDDVLVVNKPAGLIVHSDGRTKEPTLVDWVLEHYPELKDVGDASIVKSQESAVSDALRPGIVHRLDRETSGALVLAKNQIAFARLKKQFQRAQVHKTYHAFVYGSMKHDDGLIDRPIGRSRTNPVLWSATRGRRGEEREAVTEYRVLSRKGGYTFVELYPKTGRTHQLRVHLKAINYPIVSDRLYAPDLFKRGAIDDKVESRGTLHSEPALGFKRLALHSRAISFIQPSTGKRVVVEAPYPDDFKEAVEQFS